MVFSSERSEGSRKFSTFLAWEIFFKEDWSIFSHPFWKVCMCDVHECVYACSYLCECRYTCMHVYAYRDQELIWHVFFCCSHLVYWGRVHLNPELSCPAVLDSQVAPGIHHYSCALRSQAGCHTCLAFTWGLPILTPVPKLTHWAISPSLSTMEVWMDIWFYHQKK